MKKILTANFLKIGQAAKLLGVTIQTLRRWDESGKLTPVTTPGGTRLYSKEQLLHINPNVSFKNGPDLTKPETVTALTSAPIKTQEVFKPPLPPPLLSLPVPKPAGTKFGHWVPAFFAVVILVVALILNIYITSYENKFLGTKDLSSNVLSYSDTKRTFEVNIDTNLKSNLTVTGNADISGDTSVGGTLTAQNLSINALTLRAPTKQITLGTGKQITLPDADTTLVGIDTSQTLTNKSISGGSNTLSNIANSSLTNSKVTITAGTNMSGGGDVSLGSSISLNLSNNISVSSVSATNIFVNSYATISAGLSVGTSTPDSSAILDVMSITRGFLPPRMTQAQRDAIVNPAAGLVVYNTDTSALNIFTTVWGPIGAGDTAWTNIAGGIYYSAGNVGIGTSTPVGRLSVYGLNATTSVASVAGATNFASLVVDNTIGDLFAASSSGLNRFVITNAGNVGVGTAAPNASALLDLTSITKGFLPPRMTQAQRDAIVNPAAGLVVYNTDTSALNIFTTVWGPIGAGDTAWTNIAGGIYYNSGVVGIGTTTPASLLSLGTNSDVQINGTGNVSARTFNGNVIATGSGTLSIAGTSAINQDVQTTATPTFTGLNVTRDYDGTTALNITNTYETSNAKLALNFGYNTGTVYGSLGFNTNTGVMTLMQGLYKNLSFGTNNTTQMTLNNTGSLGIGTDSPSDKLDVRGNITILNGGYIRPTSDSTVAIRIANVAGVSFVDFDTSNYRMVFRKPLDSTTVTIDGGAGSITSNEALVLTAGTGQYLTLGVVSEQMRLTADGSLGVGTSTPVGRLDVRGLNATTSVASVAGATNFAALVVDNAIGDLITASSSGLTRFTISNTGVLTAANVSGTNTGDQNLFSTFAVSGQDNIVAETTSDTLTLAAGSNITLTTVAGTDTLTIAASGITSSQWTTSASGIYYGSRVGIGNLTDPTLATLDLRGISGTLPVASISGSTSMAGLIVDNTVGDLFTASSSGLNRFVITNAGNVGIGTTAPGAKLDVRNGDILLSRSEDANYYVSMDLNYSGEDTFNLTGVYGSFLQHNIINGGVNTILGINGYNTLLNGNVGIGTTSPLATLDVRGNSGITPVASISGTTAMAAMIVNNNQGDIFTASASGLNRFVITNAGNVGIGTTNPLAKLDILAAGLSHVQIGMSGTIQNYFDGDTQVFRNGSGVEAVRMTGGNVGIGTTSPSSLLSVGANSDVQINGTGNVSARTFNGNTISTGSGVLTLAAGKTLTASNTLTFSGTDGSTLNIGTGGTLGTAAYTAATAYQASNANLTSLAGLSYSSAAFVKMTNANTFTLDTNTYLTSVTGTANQINVTSSTLSLAPDVKIWGDMNAATFNGNTIATGSGVLTITGTTSISGANTGDITLGAIGSTPNANGMTLTNQVLNLQPADGTYGGIVSTTTQVFAGTKTLTSPIIANIAPGADFTITQNSVAPFTSVNTGALANTLYLKTGQVGIGTSTPVGRLDVRGLNGITSTASISGSTSMAGLIVDNTVGDIFTASSSGLNRFVITNAGNVGIGTTAPTSKLQIATGHIQLDNGYALNFGGTSDSFSGNGDSHYLNFWTNTVERMRIDTNGSVGIGTTAPLARLDTRLNGTTAVASVSGITSFASLVVDNSGSGDLFTASNSGLTRFTINNAGAISQVAGITSSGVISFTGLSADGAATNAIFLNGSNQLATRTLGSNAFNSTAFLTAVTGTANQINSTGSVLSLAPDVKIWGDMNAATFNGNTIATGSGVLTITGTTSISGANTGDQTGTANQINLTGSAFSLAPDVKVWGDVTAATFNGNTIATGTGTLSLAAGKTLTASNTLTFSGTDGSTLNIGTGGTLGTAAYTAATAYQASNANLTSLAGLSYSSAAFVKMTNANTFTLDTNTYLTSVTGTANQINVTSSTLSLAPDVKIWGDMNAATFNGNTIATGTGTLSLAAGKILTASNTLTFAGTDSSTLNVGTGGTLGTAAYTAATAYQAAHANLTSLAGLSYTSAAFVKMTNANTFTLDTTVYTSSQWTTSASGIYYGSRVGIGNLTDPTLGTLDVRGMSGILPVASVSGNTSFAAMVVDNKLGDIFTASASGLTRFVVTNAGNVGIGTTAPSAILQISSALTGTNYFDIQQSGSSLFTVSDVGITNNLPTSFNAAGDVAVAYDINFTNATSSYIKSAAPLYLQAGETFNSSDLNLTAFNKGNIIANTEAFIVNGAATISGQLVLGTTAPTLIPAAYGKLYIEDSSTSTASAFIFNTSTTNPTVLALKVGDTSPNTSHFIDLIDGNGKRIGTAKATSDTAVTWQSGGIDLAEYFQVSSGINPANLTLGTAMCQSDDGLKTCNASDSAKFVGLVSTAPAFLGGEEGPNKVMVGLIGQIPVKISTDSLAIKAGDFLILGDNGTARKSTGKGYTIGKALESWTPGQTSTVLTLLNSSYSVGDVGLSVDMADLSEEISSKLALIPTIQAEIASLSQEMASVSARLTNVETNNLTYYPTNPLSDLDIATISGDLKVLGLTELANTNIGGELTVGLLHFDDLKAEISSLTGLVTIGGDLNVMGDATVSGTLNTDKINANGLELKDKITGDIYCVTIENGEMIRKKGECSP